MNEDSYPDNIVIDNGDETQDFNNPVETQTSTSGADGADGATPYIWTAAAVSLLIDEYVNHKDEFNSPHVTKKAVWIKITKQLLNLKFPVNSGQVENKWKHMVNNYKIAEDKNKTSGQGRATCLRYEQLDEIFAKSVNIQPVAMASNLKRLDSDPDKNDAPAKRNRVNETVQRHRSPPEPVWMKAWRDEQNDRHAEKLAVLKNIADEECNFNRELLQLLRIERERADKSG